MSLLRTAIVHGVVCRFVILFVLASGARAATPVTCASPRNPQPQPTEYFVSLADTGKHLAHVSIRLHEGSGVRTLNMPVWNALYQVRDFAANIEDVRAQDATGAPAAVINTKTSQWEITAPPGCVVVSYDIRLDAAGPFGSMLNDQHGFLNWAMVLMYAPALRSQTMSVRLQDVPPSWAMRDLHVLGFALPGKAGEATGVAQTYDALADSPVELGVFQQSVFQQDGATYHVVVDADGADYDLSKIDTLLARITHAAVDWMQDRPFDEYTFLYHFPRGHGAGGMEHAYGTAIDVNADSLRDNLIPLAGVSAHEFFHLWNVKRIRPQSLEPIDYQRENDTRALWFSEGVTSTVGDMLLARANIIGDREYLQRLASEITELQQRPAHSWQSVEESSLDAWFEGIPSYRSPQRSISYYNKGEIVGVLLDLRIRELTNGTKSLRDLFQWMNEHYAKQHRFFPDSAGVQLAAEAVAGQNFEDFFRDYVSGVKQIPYDDFLQFVGLHIVVNSSQSATAGFATAANIGALPEVVRVDPNSDAQRAGIAAGDRVTEINGRPANASLDDDIARLQPGTIIHLQLENRRGKRDVEVRLATREVEVYELQDLTTVTPAQHAHRSAWIHGDDEQRAAP